MTDDFDAPPLDPKWTRRNVPMTDPVEVLAAAHQWHESGCPYCAALDPLLVALNDIEHNDAAERDLIVSMARALWDNGYNAGRYEATALRASGFDVVPTGDAHPDDGHAHSWGCRRCGVDPVTLGEATEKPTGEPAGSADAATYLDDVSYQSGYEDGRAVGRAESTGTLDVERLARAMGGHLWGVNDVVRLAAEYARLSDTGERRPALPPSDPSLIGWLGKKLDTGERR